VQPVKVKVAISKTDPLPYPRESDTATRNEVRAKLTSGWIILTHALIPRARGAGLQDELTILDVGTLANASSVKLGHGTGEDRSNSFLSREVLHLHQTTFRYQARFDVTPKRDEKLSGERHDCNTLYTALAITDSLPEPSR
jgi:hypothetical protein